jgi:hypothetical protein
MVLSRHPDRNNATNADAYALFLLQIIVQPSKVVQGCTYSEARQPQLFNVVA